MMTDTSAGQTKGSTCGCGGPGKWIWVILALAIAGVLIAKHIGRKPPQAQPQEATVTAPEAPAAPTTESGKALPRLVDLGANTCIPCKMMAPILEELKTTCAGKLDVQFIDIGTYPDQGKPYAINLIPTQIFYSPEGTELFRHEGFFSKADILAKWKEFGVDLETVPQTEPSGKNEIVREAPLTTVERRPETICSLCERALDAKSRVVADAPGGQANLCSVHCFAIYDSRLRDTTAVTGSVTVADSVTGTAIPIEHAVFLVSKTPEGRPAIRAFEKHEAAIAEQARTPGEIMAWTNLLARERSTRCGFCDRPVYKADASRVAVIEMQKSCCGEKAVPLERTWACCPMCALGICAKTQKDIEVVQKDALTGEDITVRTLNRQVAWALPATTVAWHGQRKGKDGTMTSSGCFHQFLFANGENLRRWLEAHPEESGASLSLAQALADMINLSQDPITNACTTGAGEGK